MLKKQFLNNSTHWNMFVQLILLVGVSSTLGSPCYEYGCHKPYVPAPPGKTPPCAKHGMTFCESIDRYPQYVIKYLIHKWQFDFNSLFSSERREEFRPRPVYGPPPPHPTRPGYHYEPPRQAFNLPTFHSTSHFNQSGGGFQVTGHELFSEDSSFLYPPVQPSFTPYDPNSWWKRWGRSKRQAGSTLTLCPTVSQYVLPKAALNNKGNWMYIVNLDQTQRYTQLVKSETCVSNECNGICSLPNGYSSKCEQQFVQKKLVALDGSGDRLYTDVFWLPHCCVCQIQQNLI